MPEIQIRFKDGTTISRTLEDRRVTLGRGPSNELQFADDPALSRQHLALEPEAGQWWASDLGSRNGTRLNGEALKERRKLGPGDMLEAGALTLFFLDTPRTGDHTVVFTPQEGADEPFTASAQMRLNEAITDNTRLERVFLRTTPAAAAARLQALFMAGRELAGRRPLDELFPLILKLAADAVGAERGVVMTVEQEALVTRAARGADFRISTAVRDRVLSGRESLLIHDVASDQALRESHTLVQHRVRTLLAVPLQTEETVIGLIYLDSTAGRPFNSDDLTLLTVLANIAAIRIEHARLIELEQAEKVMQAEMRQAAEIQQSLLPKRDPTVEGFDIAGHSEPCRTVNGDYYDYVQLSGGRLLLIVGDVAGKGISAALLLAGLQARLHTIAEEDLPVETIVSRLNGGLLASMPVNRFVTMFTAILDPATAELSYTNAGHNPPLLFRANGEVVELMEGGPVLGVLRGMPYGAGRFHMERGDVLMMFSDGVTEAASPEKEDFGEERLKTLGRARRGGSAAELVAAVRDAVAAHIDGAVAADDVTVVVVKRV